MRKIVVASKNPVKMNAVTAAFQRMFPGEVFVVKGVSVSSGVAAQPKSRKKALTGGRFESRGPC